MFLFILNKANNKFDDCNFWSQENAKKRKIILLYLVYHEYKYIYIKLIKFLYI